MTGKVVIILNNTLYTTTCVPVCLKHEEKTFATAVLKKEKSPQRNEETLQGRTKTICGAEKFPSRCRERWKRGEGRMSLSRAHDEL